MFYQDVYVPSPMDIVAENTTALIIVSVIVLASIVGLVLLKKGKK